MARFYGRGVFLAVFLAGLSVLVSVWPAHAQLLQGSITGNVTDSSQAAVVGAKVVATEQTTNFTRDTTTNGAGVYNLLTMPPGTYTVTVTAPAFGTMTVTGLRVSPEEVTRRDVTLTVGQLTQNVQVTAEANTLETDRADVRQDVSANLLVNVPVPVGRNYQNLFITLPGISPPTNANSFTANAARGLTFTAGGGNSGYNSTRVDGTGTFDMTANTAVQFVPALEAIENVSIATNSFDAEQSAGGAAVNISVKSGTNDVHGVLYEDHTDQHIQAYPWAANRSQPNPKYINNQYGFTIGGPIKKDKLFYFVSFEGTGLVGTGPFLAEVPTAQMRTGNLSASPTIIYDPLTGNPNGSGRQPFAGNIIPANRIDPGVQNLFNYNTPEGRYSLPNQPGIGSLGLTNNLVTEGTTYLRRAQTDAKFNWNPTPKLSTFVRVGWHNNNWSTPQQFGVLGGPNLSQVNNSAGVGGADVISGTFSGTYIISPSLVFDAHYGYDANIAYSRQPGLQYNFGSTLMQIPGLSTAAQPPAIAREGGGLPALSIQGMSALGNNTSQPQSYYDREHNIDANLSKIKGTHNLRFGFDSDFMYTMEFQALVTGGDPFIGSAGGFYFAQGTTQLLQANGKPSTANEYNSFAAMLLGFSQDSGKMFQWPQNYYTNTKYMALYARDQWQVTPKLTVTAGVRADYYFVPLRNGTGMEYYDKTTNNMVICGVPVTKTPDNCNIFNQYQLHFVPRLGVAYRLGGSTVIRAGFGMATDPTNLFAFGERRSNFPYVQQVALLPPNSLSYATTLRQGIPTVTAPDIAAGLIPVPGTVALWDYNRANYKRGYVSTYNFTIEQRIKPNWTASVGYAGTEQIDPMTSLQENWSPIGTGTAGQLLNTPVSGNRTASTQLLGVMGSTNYNSLQARTQGRIAGLTFNIGFTFAKNLGFIAPTSVQGGAAMPWLYRTYDYGPLPIDITRNFEVTAVYELPFGKGKHWVSTGMAANILGDWQISGLFSDFSGRPFTVVANATSLNLVNSYQFANCIATPQKVGTLLQWYNPAAFSQPTGTSFGTCGQDALRGPGLINGDGGIEKRFTFRERWRFAFRAEMYNVGNTPHHAAPGSGPFTSTSTANNVSSSSFMNVTLLANTGRDGLDQRTVKFSLKMTF